MFQTVFQRLDDGTMVGPLFALLVFMLVFFTQLVRILRKPHHEVQAQAMLPLAEDAPAPLSPPNGPRRGEEAHR